MSLKVKFISLVSLFMLMIGVLTIGVLAAIQQTLTIQGNVNFVVADKSLYVKDVRYKETGGEEIDIASFSPGYINGNFSMNLTTITDVNNHGSFALYFDIINTSDIMWQISEVQLSATLQSQGVSVKYDGIVNVGSTAESTQITESTQIDGTLVVIIIAPNSNSIDLSGITIFLNEYIPRYEDFAFSINEENKSATLTSYSGTATSVEIPSTIGDVEIEKITSFTLNRKAEAIEIAKKAMQEIMKVIDGGKGSLSLEETQILYMFASTFSYEGINGDKVLSDGLDGILDAMNGEYSTLENSFNALNYPTTIELDYKYTVKLGDETSIGLYVYMAAQASGRSDGIVRVTDGFLTPGEYTIAEIITEISNGDFDGSVNYINIELNPIIGQTTVYHGTKYTVTGIEMAFFSYSNLESIVIPDSVTYIGQGAFASCSNLTEVTIPKAVTIIDYGAFDSCISLRSVTFEEGTQLTNIRDNAFYGCRNITSMEIPSSVTTIGDGAFDYCYSLVEIYNYSRAIQKVEIGNSNSSINGRLGYYAKSVYNSSEGGSRPATKIVVENNVQYYVDDGEVIALSPSLVRNSVTEVLLRADTTSINQSAFSDCSNLISIEIPSKVTSIGEGAFYNCNSLTNIAIPATVTSIETDTFSNCSSLTNITIPTSVESIGNYAFSDCSNLTSIEIPSNVKNIGYWAFSNCSKLTIMTINAINPPTLGSAALSGCSELTHIYVPSASVSAYRGASGWSSYLSKISAIV